MKNSLLSLAAIAGLLPWGLCGASQQYFNTAFLQEGTPVPQITVFDDNGNPGIVTLNLLEGQVPRGFDQDPIDGKVYILSVKQVNGVQECQVTVVEPDGDAFAMTRFTCDGPQPREIEVLPGGTSEHIISFGYSLKDYDPLTGFYNDYSIEYSNPVDQEGHPLNAPFVLGISEPIKGLIVNGSQAPAIVLDTANAIMAKVVGVDTVEKRVFLEAIGTSVHLYDVLYDNPFSIDQGSSSQPAAFFYRAAQTAGGSPVATLCPGSIATGDLSGSIGSHAGEDRNSPGYMALCSEPHKDANLSGVVAVASISPLVIPDQNHDEDDPEAASFEFSMLCLLALTGLARKWLQTSRTHY